VFEHVGRMPNLEDQDRFNKILHDFLQGISMVTKTDLNRDECPVAWMRMRHCLDTGLNRTYNETLSPNCPRGLRTYRSNYKTEET
jgi:hypothetical protein